MPKPLSFVFLSLLLFVGCTRQPVNNWPSSVSVGSKVIVQTDAQSIADALDEVSNSLLKSHGSVITPAPRPLTVTKIEENWMTVEYSGKTIVLNKDHITSLVLVTEN